MSNKSWTFLVNSVTLAGAGVTVSGNFVLFEYGLDESADPRGQEPKFSMHYLTKAEEPVTFELPKWMFQGKVSSLDAVCAKDVEDLLKEIFTDGYDYVPTPPSELPLHKAPPSWRDAMVQASETTKNSRTLN